MSIDLGRIRVLGADAVGQPGQRRFRLFVQAARGSAIIWMEKEQLNTLSMMIDRVLAQVTEGQILRVEARADGESGPVPIPADFPSTPSYEFQVGQIKLSFDEREAIFSLDVTPLSIIMKPDTEPQLVMREEDTISFVFTQQNALQLSHSITAVVVSGRPVCPLCHTPLDGGPHACVKQNGHREILHIEEREDEEEE
ncbi:MAG TPA: DUF3090 family protein [Ktedonobacteraceae bacterium]|nr:DUF3090 family protein [Ktedonobacteraceae bacterium]